MDSTYSWLLLPWVQATLRVRSPEGEANSSQHVLTAFTGTAEGRRGPLPVSLPRSLLPSSSPIPLGLKVSSPWPSSPPEQHRGMMPPWALMEVMVVAKGGMVCVGAMSGLPTVGVG